MSRGGSRGGGLKKGQKKVNLKPLNKRRTVKKSYNWTPDEYHDIQQAVRLLRKRESKFVQAAVMAAVKEALKEAV